MQAGTAPAPATGEKTVFVQGGNVVTTYLGSQVPRPADKAPSPTAAQAEESASSRKSTENPSRLRAEAHAADDEVASTRGSTHDGERLCGARSPLKKAAASPV